MKKIISFISAAVMSASMVSVNAMAEDKSETLQLFFEADQTEGIHILKDGTVYINRANMNENGIDIKTRVYMEETRNDIGIVTVKWKASTDKITLTDIVDPITIAGASPFNEFKKSDSMLLSTNTVKLYQAVTYNLGLNYSTFTFTGDSADDYPIAGFTAKIPADIEAGTYSIYFPNTDTVFSDIVYRTSKGVIEVFPEGDSVRPLNIIVSDQNYGDVNNSGKTDGVDASAILAEYAELSAEGKGTMTEEQSIIADVDFNGAVDGRDASIVLGYYAYLSSEGDLPLLEYLKELNGGQKQVSEQ